MTCVGLLRDHLGAGFQEALVAPYSLALLCRAISWLAQSEAQRPSSPLGTPEDFPTENLDIFGGVVCRKFFRAFCQKS